MSKVVDPQGNAVLLEYDSTYSTRLKYIHDATGLSTQFYYEYAGQPYLVTRALDPYSREAIFTYNLRSGAVRLTAIEDVYGIVSSFDYNAGGGITALTTPYGTTTFELSELDLGNYSLIRFIEAIDPYGAKERIEYNLSTGLTGVPLYNNEPKPDSSIVRYQASDNDDRNSFYWDKQQMKYGEGDYSKAHLYHWVQPDTADAATSILESEKPPLESRIWYNYPGQSQPYIQGNSASPSVVGRVVEDEAGTLVTQASKFEYNSLGNLTKEIDPEGRETLTQYAANGMDVLSVKQRTGGTDVAPLYSTLASFTYDPADPPRRPRTTTDSAGNTTTFGYNAFGQIQTVTNDLNEVISLIYETQPANNGYGKILQITGDVPGGNMTFTYDSYDRIRTATNSENHTLVYNYDMLDRVTVITYPDTSYEQFDYENHSMVASRDRAGRWTRYFHNALRQPVLQRDPLGQLTQYEWCRCGHIRKIIDGNNNATHWKRDVQGRVYEKRFADGSKQKYSYYPLSGQLQTVTDALNQTANRSYYADGNLAEIDFSATNTADEMFTYGTWYDRLESITDGIGTAQYVYHPDDGASDGAGMLARINGPWADDTRKFTYDRLGRLKKREIVDDATFSTASYSEEVVFDTRSRVKDVINNLGTFNLFYVGQSNRVDSMDYPNGMQTDFTYTHVNGDHLIQQIQHLNSATVPALISQFDYTYRQDRNIENWTVAQGAATPSQWTFGYDDALRLSSAVRTNASTQAVLHKLGYGYDKAGNRTSVMKGSNSTNYPANELNQLTTKQGFGKTPFMGTLDEPALVTINGQTAQVTSAGGHAPYTFQALVDLAEGNNTVTIEATDGDGNIATQSYSVVAAGVQMQLEYDSNGNLRFEKTLQNAVLREFQWDAKNRLIKIIDGTETSEFTYDGLDRRVRMIEKNNGAVISNRTYLWDGTHIVQKRDSTGAAVQRNYFSNGFTEGSNSYYCTKDHLGSIREVVASDGITVEARYEYSPWGQVTKIGGIGVESDFRYTGHLYHEPSDLHLTLYRAYDAETGRWLSVDPLERVTGEMAEMLPEGAGLYGYVGNNPVNGLDPLGKSAFWNWLLNHVVWGVQGELGDGWGASAGVTDKVFRCSPASVSGGIGPGKLGAGVGGGIGLQFGPGVQGAQIELGLAGGARWGGAVTWALALDGGHGWEVTVLGGLGLGVGGAITLGKQNSENQQACENP